MTIEQSGSTETRKASLSPPPPERKEPTEEKKSALDSTPPNPDADQSREAARNELGSKKLAEA